MNLYARNDQGTIGTIVLLCADPIDVDYEPHC